MVSDIKIKVPATTANLGPGFDCVGMALNLYNEFSFSKKDKISVEGFDEAFGLDRNLVYQAYRFVFERIEKNIIPVKITLEENNIPISRGLGSSAGCIVAGVLAANIFLDNPLNCEELLSIMSELEGHPDNVACAYMGGMIASYKLNNGLYKSCRYEINNELKMFVIIPDFELSTKVSREVLPKFLSYEDIIHNISRVINIPLAFKEGNVKMLKELLDDKMHEPYRLPLIDDAYKIRDLAHGLDYAFCLSGAGPTLLAIGKHYELIKQIRILDLVHNWKVLALDVNNNGAIVEVV